MLWIILNSIFGYVIDETRRTREKWRKECVEQQREERVESGESGRVGEWKVGV
jgi:hypothetical protein